MEVVNGVDTRHAANLAKLAAARAEEKEARRLRREGRDVEAIEAYYLARDLYANTDLAFHERGESELADEVKRATERCNKIASNLRHPKETRPPATTPRPNCLACDKPLRRFKYDGKTFSDGTPREWGDYGDNRFCGLRCGWSWACSHSKSMRGSSTPNKSIPSKPSRKANP
jgi:hypothetical protein